MQRAATARPQRHATTTLRSCGRAIRRPPSTRSKRCPSVASVFEHVEPQYWDGRFFSLATRDEVRAAYSRHHYIPPNVPRRRNCRCGSRSGASSCAQGSPDPTISGRSRTALTTPVPRSAHRASLGVSEPMPTQSRDLATRRVASSNPVFRSPTKSRSCCGSDTRNRISASERAPSTIDWLCL